MVARRTAQEALITEISGPFEGSLLTKDLMSRARVPKKIYYVPGSKGNLGISKPLFFAEE